MATKVKPSRINITGVPQAGQVPMYVDDNEFQWGNAGSGGYGRFLSLWDATTGLPISFPEATPYTYLTGDYYIVETVSSATPPVNYRPAGSTYTGTASSTTESDELEVGDVYVFDGTVWLLQSNHGKTVTFANIAGQPTDNANLATALGAKADDNAVVKLSGNQTINDTKTFTTSPVVPSKTSDATNTGTAIATEAQVYKKQDTLTTQSAYTSQGTSTKVPTITTNTLGQVTGITETSIAFPVTSVNGNTGAVTLDADDISDTGTTNQWTNATEKGTWNGKQDQFYTIDSTAPNTPSQGDEWYDTVNDELKTYDGSNWNTVGAGTGDVAYADFAYTALSGTTITINSLSNTLTTSADVTVNAGTSLKPGLTYLLRVTNSDTSAHTVTINSEALYLPASSTVNYVLLALTSSTFEYQDPGYRIVATLPATPTPGVVYYVMS